MKKSSLGMSCIDEATPWDACQYAKSNANTFVRACANRVFRPCVLGSTSRAPLSWSLNNQWENPMQTLLPQVLLQCFCADNQALDLSYQCALQSSCHHEASEAQKVQWVHQQNHKLMQIKHALYRSYWCVKERFKGIEWLRRTKSTRSTPPRVQNTWCIRVWHGLNADNSFPKEVLGVVVVPN